ncbi:uncharacterized protein [Gossypium hirsutum]|uniref:Gag-pro-like protein n=1 Tax=Gossypium hirsutum TaxID=3635 RepID=A0A1U8IDB2_GOSHI|nr:uncharacterized protein LOC107895410 [Gossypium hirsutum]
MVLFINTLKAQFYDKLVGSATKDFVDIVISGELIENAIKSGRMEGSESSKRAAPVKKKEAEAYMVGTENHYTSNPYPTQSRARYRPPPNFYYPPQSLYYQAPPHYPSYLVYATNNQRPVTTFPQNTMPAQSQPKDEQRLTRSNPEKPQFNPIPVSYGELCMYHAGNQRHSTENCLAFKRKVQGLIDAGILRFDGTSNTTRNPFPNHTEGNVSAVTEEDKWRTKSCVSKIKTPLQKIWKVMVEKGLFCCLYRIFKEGSIKSQCFCDFHGIEGHDIQSCEEFRKLLQYMMDNKEIGIFNKEADEGEVCAFDNQSSSFPYSTDRPLVIYYGAKKEQVKPKMIIEVPSPFPYKGNKAVPWKYDVNIITPKGEKSKAMTRSVGEIGHFTRSGRSYSKMVEPTKKTSDLNQKGKVPMHEAEVKLKTPSVQEVKRPVNEDEAHEFLKFIKHSEYNVVEQLRKQPERISALSLLLNSESHQNALLKVNDEIPPNGRGSVKALHITTRCKGYIIPNALIDNGSALNVMPLATLSRIPIDLSYLRPCHSTKFIMDGLLVTVVGEEDIVASISTDTPYLEVSKDAVECSFHSFEFINATFVAKGNKILMPKLSRNTEMGIKLIVGKGARARKGLGRYQQGIVRALRPVPHKA